MDFSGIDAAFWERFRVFTRQNAWVLTHIVLWLLIGFTIIELELVFVTIPAVAALVGFWQQRIIDKQVQYQVTGWWLGSLIGATIFSIASRWFLLNGMGSMAVDWDAQVPYVLTILMLVVTYKMLVALCQTVVLFVHRVRLPWYWLLVNLAGSIVLCGMLLPSVISVYNSDVRNEWFLLVSPAYPLSFIGVGIPVLVSGFISTYGMKKLFYFGINERP